MTWKKGDNWFSTSNPCCEISIAPKMTRYEFMNCNHQKLNEERKNCLTYIDIENFKYFKKVVIA